MRLRPPSLRPGTARSTLRSAELDKVDECKLVLEQTRVNARVPTRRGSPVPRPHEDDDDDATALAAIRLLVRDIPRGRQKEAARRIYELLRAAYGDAGPPTPEWLPSLRRRVDAEFR